MKDSEKIKKIKATVRKAEKDFEKAKFVYTRNKKGVINGVAVKESKAHERKRLEKNFIVYAKALERINTLVAGSRQSRKQ